MLDLKTFNEELEREQLEGLLLKFYDERNTFKFSASLLQNVEALLMVMNENRAEPDGEIYSDAAGRLLTVSLKLKWELLFDMLLEIVLSENDDEKSFFSVLEVSLTAIRYLRSWNLKHPY